MFIILSRYDRYQLYIQNDLTDVQNVLTLKINIDDLIISRIIQNSGFVINLCVKIEKTDVIENHFVINENKHYHKYWKKLRCLMNKKEINEKLCLLVRLFIHFIRLFIYSSAYLFIYSSVHLFIYSSVYLSIYSFVYLFSYSLIDLNSESTLKILTWMKVILS